HLPACPRLCGCCGSHEKEVAANQAGAKSSRNCPPQSNEATHAGPVGPLSQGVRGVSSLGSPGTMGKGHCRDRRQRSFLARGNSQKTLPCFHRERGSGERTG